jgi:hypothetical protein
MFPRQHGILQEVCISAINSDQKVSFSFLTTEYKKKKKEGERHFDNL